MAKVIPTTQAAGKNAPANTSTKPQAADKKDKKEREAKPERADFLTATKVNVKDPSAYPFKGTYEGEGDARRLTRATPAGFDFDKHERLSKKDFDKPSIYTEYRAEELEYRAKQLRQKATEMRAGGDKKGSGGKANRLIKAMAKAEEIRKELAAAGVDVDALIAKAREEAAAKGTNPAGEKMPATQPAK